MSDVLSRSERRKLVAEVLDELATIIDRGPVDGVELRKSLTERAGFIHDEAEKRAKLDAMREKTDEDSSGVRTFKG